jgi:acyl-CoA thioesterase-1
MRIILIGDSLLMSRPADHIFYEDTYGYLVMKALPYDEVIIRGRYSNDTSIQAKRDNLICDLEYYNPDVVCIQLGIVDCAPRIFSKRDCSVVSSLPVKIKKPLIKFLSKRRLLLTKYFPKVYVKINDFEKNMQIILNSIIKCKALPILINIPKTSERNVQRSSNYLLNIKKYNKVLDDLTSRNNCASVDLYNIIDKNPEYLWTDGIHLSKEGSKALAEEIVRIAQKENS